MPRGRKSGDMFCIGRLILKTREPDKYILSLSHWERRKVVDAALGHEITQDQGTSINQCRLQRSFEEVAEVVTSRRIQMIDCANHKSPSLFLVTGQRTVGVCEQESRARPRRAQEQYIVRVDHRGV